MKWQISKSMLAVLLVLCMMMSMLAGCSSSTDSGDTQSAGNSESAESSDSAEDAEDAESGEDSDSDVEKVFRFATSTEPTSLDPQLGSGVWITNVTCAIFEGLVRRYDGEIIPGIAESWEASDDGLTYTFYLREVSWSDGTPVTAQDFVDSWNLMNERATPMTLYTEYFTLDDGTVNAEALDDLTLEVTLNYQVPFILEVFASSAMSVVRVDKYEEYGDAYYQTIPEAMIGPYILTEWKANDVMVLEPNPDYWNADAVNFDRVEIYTVTDSTTQVNMYDSGEIDMLNVPDTMYSEYEDKGIEYYNDGSTYFIQFTTDGSTDETAKYLANRNFIEALSYCIDREDFVNAVYGGVYEASTEFVPYTATGYVNGSKADSNVTVDSPFSIKADLELAQEKLDAALEELGVTADEMPSFTLVVNDTTLRQTAAQYIQDVCSQIGITLVIDTIPSATFWSTLREGYRYDFALAGSGPDYDDASTFLMVFDGESKYANTFMRWQDEEYSEVQQHSWLVSDEERNDDLVWMESYLLNNGPIIPLYFTTAAWVLADGFSNINRNMTGADLDFVFGDYN